MNETNFNHLKELIYHASGIAFDYADVATLEHRLWPRIEALKLRSLDQYIYYLQFDPNRHDELQNMIDAVVVTDTYFFREARALRAFQEEILPELVENDYGARTLRVWSAGCSTGEEAYTLAMLLLETPYLADWAVEVLGTDISQAVLNLARAGRYPESSFRAMDAATRDKYFTLQTDGHWLIDERLRQMVHFSLNNLAERRYINMLSDVDLIFCRNVLTYFDDNARRRAAERFQHQMRDGGYLILGVSESLNHLNTPFRMVHLENDLAYQK
jgi:chemotaxis protein methyltransferase CheR